MSDHTPFRIILAIWFVAMVAIALPHRLRAHRAGGAVPRRGEGLALMIGLRLAMFAWFEGVILWIIRPGMMGWSSLEVHEALRWTGAGLALATLPLVYWVFHTLGLNITDTVEVRERHTLVTHGPYRWVRHPLYTALLILVPASLLVTTNLYVGLCGALGVYLISRRTRIEEAKLIERYGDVYRGYMARTGGFLPRVGAARSTSALAALLALFAPVLLKAEPARELSTDRPDRTESPYSVEPGRLQIETDVIKHTRDRVGAERSRDLSVAGTNLKVGLARRADLQLVVDGWSRERIERAGSPTVSRSGVGDVTARLKLNLRGNDGGRWAFAAMPFVTLPRGEEGEGWARREGGLILPLALELPRGFGLGAMGEVDLRPDAAGTGQHAEWIASITTSHEIAGGLSGFVELYSLQSAARGSDWIGTFDAGITWALTPDFQLDTGFNAGLSSAAEDLTMFVGLSARR